MHEAVTFWSFVTAVLTLIVAPGLGYVVRRMLAHKDEAASRYEQAIEETRDEVEKVSARYVTRLEEAMELKARLVYQEKLLERSETEERRLRGELERCIREREKLRGLRT